MKTFILTALAAGLSLLMVEAGKALAQIPVGPELTPFVNGGLLGCVLAWFMFRAEPRFKGLEEAVDRLGRALMLFLLSFEGVSHGGKQAAQEMLEELKSAEQDRRK